MQIIRHFYACRLPRERGLKSIPLPRVVPNRGDWFDTKVPVQGALGKSVVTTVQFLFRAPGGVNVKQEGFNYCTEWDRPCKPDFPKYEPLKGDISTEISAADKWVSVNENNRIYRSAGQVYGCRMGQEVAMAAENYLQVGSHWLGKDAVRAYASGGETPLGYPHAGQGRCPEQDVISQKNSVFSANQTGTYGSHCTIACQAPVFHKISKSGICSEQRFKFTSGNSVAGQLRHISGWPWLAQQLRLSGGAELQARLFSQSVHDFQKEQSSGEREGNADSGPRDRWTGIEQRRMDQLEQEVKNREAEHGADHLQVADACMGVAIAHLQSGRFVEAELPCERAHAIILRQGSTVEDTDGMGGDENSFQELVEVASETFLQLAVACVGSKECEKGLRWASCAKDILASIRAENKAKEFLLAMVDTTQGMAYAELNQWEPAASSVEAALSRMIEYVGTEHVFVAQAQYNVADVYVKIGRLEDAATLLRASRATRIQKLGRSHYLTNMTTKRLMAVAMELGNEEECKSCFEELESIGSFD